MNFNQLYRLIMVSVEPSGNINVFSINDEQLNQPNLVDNLYQQFKQHCKMTS
jgi:hypothetical protein